MREGADGEEEEEEVGESIDTDNGAGGDELVFPAEGSYNNCPDGDDDEVGDEIDSVSIVNPGLFSALRSVTGISCNLNCSKCLLCFSDCLLCSSIAARLLAGLGGSTSLL